MCTHTFVARGKSLFLIKSVLEISATNSPFSLITGSLPFFDFASILFASTSDTGSFAVINCLFVHENVFSSIYISILV
jgi:hypothetical protein